MRAPTRASCPPAGPLTARCRPPQIIEHARKSLTQTVHETRWVPCSARFVVLGSPPRGTGLVQIYNLSKGELHLLHEVEKPSPLKCGSFGASSLAERRLATGDFGGKLQLWDLEAMEAPVFSAQAHSGLINCLDAIGGLKGSGAPEIATGGKDGRVLVWDPRQPEAPVAAMEPKPGEVARDCWAVTFGDSHTSDDRVVAAGYDNGDVKLLDLRAGKVRWETNVQNGVCGLQFDRNDIEMNKLVVTTLESRFRLYDMRTFHPTFGARCGPLAASPRARVRGAIGVKAGGSGRVREWDGCARASATWRPASPGRACPCPPLTPRAPPHRLRTASLAQATRCSRRRRTSRRCGASRTCRRTATSS